MAEIEFLRMKPGHGEVLLARGERESHADSERLVAEFRRQLEGGMWAAVPIEALGGRRRAELVRGFDEVPAEATRVVFFPPAAGG